MNIEPDEIHIWRASCEPDTVPIETSLLPLDDQEKVLANRFHFAIHRIRYIYAHVLLKRILASYLHCNSHQVILIKGERGKPAIHYPVTTLQFNLSHSENEVIIALHANLPLGVDIEMIKNKYEEKIAERFFSQAEQKELHDCLPEDRIPAFYYLWSAKEALIKATGKGLHLPLNQFSVKLNTVVQLVRLETTDWLVISLNERAAFKSAIACHPSVKTMRYCAWEENGSPIIKKTKKIKKIEPVQ
jgi:4'-phosphopantetheinyl transferase